MNTAPITFGEKLHYILNTFSKKAVMILIVAGILLFSNGLFNNFIGDDNAQILKNPAIHSISNIKIIFSGSTFYSGDSLVGQFYRPIMQFFYIIIYSITGPHPFLFHLFQLSLHIANAILLFFLLKWFLRERTSLGLALVFLIHPINSEAVLSIAALQEPLFFFFGMLGLLALLRYRSGKSLFFVAAMLFLSLLSKETGILFVIAALTYVLIYDRKRLLGLLGLSAVVVVVYGLMKGSAVGLIPRISESQINHLTLSQRILNMPEIAMFYLKTFFFPKDLAIAWRWIYTQASFTHFYLPLLSLITFSGLLIYFGRNLYNKEREKFWQFLFFLIVLAAGIGMHLQIVPFELTVSERWFYFPILGLLGIIGIIYEYMNVGRKRSLVVMFMVILLLLSGRTFARTFDWRDQLTLALHDIRVSKEDYTAENIIANEYLKLGKLDEAKSHAERSISIYPNHINYNTLGLVYLKQGKYQEARNAYFEGLEHGHIGPLYQNISELALIHGEIETNISFIKNEAVPRFPKNARLWLYLAILEYRNSNTPDAKKYISEAYRLNRNDQFIAGTYNVIMNEKPLNLDLKIQ